MASDRREFMKRAAKPLDGRRILPFNSVIRVDRIEVTRTRNEGFDEAGIHTPENVRALRDAFAGRIDRKRTRPRDAPVPLASLTPDERGLIPTWFPDLKP